MRVGIIADTHDNLSAVEDAVAQFEQAGVETIVHCGDVIAPPIIPYFEGFTLHLVFGNNDGEVAGLREAVADLDPPGEVHGRFGLIELDGTRIAFLHGERLEAVETCARSGVADVVCYGHHHELRRESIEGTTVLNPGAHFPTVPDEQRRVAVLDTADASVEFVSLA